MHTHILFLHTRLCHNHQTMGGRCEHIVAPVYAYFFGMRKKSQQLSRPRRVRVRACLLTTGSTAFVGVEPYRSSSMFYSHTYSSSNIELENGPSFQMNRLTQSYTVAFKMILLSKFPK